MPRFSNIKELRDLIQEHLDRGGSEFDSLETPTFNKMARLDTFDSGAARVVLSSSEVEILPDSGC